VGFWAGPDDLQSKRRGDVHFEPGLSPDEAAQQRKIWKRAVERSRGWVE
jgi:glycerol kinase